jgi:adenosylhomocysteine nucleosidase
MSGESHLTVGILCALPEELGSLRERARGSPRSVQGLGVLDLDVEGAHALAVVTGIGKVAAARAATILVELGARRALLVVGTCGGLSRELVPGALIHALRAIQVDHAVRAGREIESDPGLRSAWMAVAPGKEGSLLTADRPVASAWRRMRLVRAYPGPCAADMETAAVAAVAAANGIPWAALRTVTDRCDARTRTSFAQHYPTQGGRAADTVPALLHGIEGQNPRS